MGNDCEIRNATNNDHLEISNLLLDIWINEYGFKVTTSDCADTKDV